MDINVAQHYDLLIDEGNDPVLDGEVLQNYMSKWDGEPFINQLNISADKTVLEIGVGTGRLARKVAPKCAKLYGIDVSPKTVEAAKSHLALYKNVTLICADFMNYKFDCRFDVIYSSLTFMHFKNKQIATKIIADLLYPNGLAVISIDKCQDKFIDMKTRKVKIYPDNPAEMSEYIRNAGLKINSIIETEFAFIIVAQA